MQADMPVAFEGRKLTEAESKCSAIENEILGVVYHMEKWRCYLEGVHFAITSLTPALHLKGNYLQGKQDDMTPNGL